MSDYPFSRILLATERTEFDVGAERLAFAMAARCGVPLRVVFPLLSNPEYEAEMPEYARRAEQEAADKIGELRGQAKKLGIEIDVHVRRGSERHAEIVAEAVESNTDLIVIRRRGKSGFFARMLVGEMVSRVIKDAHCSVLLVPRNAEFWSHQVLAAVGDTPSAPNIAKTAGMIAAVCGLPLTVLSVATDQASLSKTQTFNILSAAMASGPAVKARGEVRIGRLVEQTQASVRENGADIVVIGRQRYHLSPFGSRSIMQDIAGNLDVPTLVVPT